MSNDGYNRIIAEARNPSHPLHSRFEWDDTKVACIYRLERARKLIEEVRKYEHRLARQGKKPRQRKKP